MINKKNMAISLVLACFVTILAVVLWMSQSTQSLQAKDKPEPQSVNNMTRGFARSLDFYLQKQGTTTGINGVKIQLEVKKNGVWEKATGTDGKILEFTTKETGRVQLVELLLRELENKYGAAGPYRFYEASQPDGYYVPSIGATSEEFSIPTEQTAHPKINMYNRLIGYYTFTVRESVTNQPLKGVTLVLQVNQGGWKTIGSDGFPTIDGVPTEFTTNSLGQVTLTPDLLAKLVNYRGFASFQVRLMVSAVPDGYFVPPMGNQYFTLGGTGTVSPAAESIVVYPNRAVTFQKTDGMTGKPLAGVAFELQNRRTETGEFVKVADAPGLTLPALVTDSNGQIHFDETVIAALRAAFPTDATEYRFKEITAPAGYRPVTDESASNSFKITPLLVTPKKVSMINMPLENELTLEKRDGVTGVLLSGATFVIQKQAGDDVWNDTAVTKTTNANGRVVLQSSDLAALGDGVYRFKETVAPAGYEAPTEESVSDSFEITGGEYVSKSFLTMRNDPLVKGEPYIRFITNSIKYKNTLDTRTGKGYVDEYEASQGWIRSNDELKVGYTVAPEEGNSRSLENLKIRVTAEILDGKGYSDFADPSKEPLQNAMFTLNTPVNEIENGFTYDSTTRTVKAWQEFVIKEVQGDFVDFSIDIKIGSTFFGTELPLRYQLEVVSATDKNTGEEIIFNQGPDKDLYHYDLLVPFPNNTLKVTSMLNMVPRIAGYNNSTNTGIYKTDFTTLTGSADYPNSKVASLGYGWQTVPLETRPTGSNLGLAVAKGNNNFNMTVNQSIMATMSNGEKIPLTLGDGSNDDLPKIELFSYGAVGQNFVDPVGIYTGKYQNYNQNALLRTYKSFLNAQPTGDYGYQATQNQQTGNIAIQATAPTYFPFYVNPKPTVPALDPNGGFQPNVLFGVGNYLVYPAEAFTMNSTRNTRETLSATQQDYTIGLAGASYEDNEGNTVEFPGDPATNGTWSETFPMPPITPPEKEYSLIMEKKDKEEGFLLTGGKFVLEYKPKGGTTWTEVTLSGFTDLSANENGQIVFTQAQLEQLVAEVGKGSYRFKEIEAPEGYRDPANYLNPDDLYSQPFDLDGDTISKTRVQIDNEPKDLGLIFRKKGEDQDGKTIDLDGAIFDLYIGRPNVPNPSKDEDYNWEKVDVQKVFNLTEAQALTKFTSSNSGQIPLTAADLTALVNYTGGNPSYGPGRYRFKEVQPPPGYALPEGDKAFSQSFQLLEDDVVPSGITMMNERIAEWKTIEKNSIGSAYGYSINDEGIDKFAPLGTSYQVPATIENLVKVAGPYSKLATNYGVALQGEEIVVGSYQEAQYYSYATDNEQYIENWQPTSAEMIQLWNPQEGEFVGASYNYFENMSDIGKTEPLKYGVKKDGDYTNGALDVATKDSYDWYNDPSSVPSGKEISAVYGEITDFKKNYRTGSHVHDEVIPTRWNLYTKRRATGTPGNGPDGKITNTNQIKGNNYYTTYTRAQITYKNYKTDVPPEDKEKTITYSNTPYKPTGYAAATGAYAPNPASSFADTLLIIPYYQPKIEKQAYNVETKEPAVNGTFSLNSMMEFGLKVTFPEPRPGTVTGSGFDFTLRDYTNYRWLKDKDNFTYRQNSSYLNSLPMDNPNYITNDSNRYLEWENIQGSYDVSNVYDLRFNAYPFETGGFTNYVVLTTWYGDQNATKGITIIDAQNSGGIHKTTTTPVIEKAGPNPHSPIDYTINLQNYVPDKYIRAVKVFDILPASGDERGSDFAGGFSLEQFTAKKMDGSSLDDDPETKYYYTTVNLPNDLTANDAFEYAGANWKEFKNITETDKKQVKAILAMLPDLPSGTFYDVHIELLPFGNQADNRYVNRARFGFNIFDVFGKDQTAEVRSRNIETVVIDRLIEGNVWQDLFYSGTMEENEPRIANVDVNLYTMDGSGKLTKIADTVTDQNGFYQFDTLAEGYYKVGFKLPPQYEDYIVTKLNVAGGDPLLTNKVSQTLMTDDGYHLTQDSILLPFYEYEKDEEGNDTDVLKTRIEEKGWNMGILPAPDMEVVKEVQKKNAKDEYEDINHGKVNIGDELRYVITVTNTVDHSFLEDIRIQDSLPEGLEYVENTLYLAHPDPTEDELLDASRYTFAPNQNGIWELQTQPLGNFDETTKEIKIYFNVTVTGGAKGKLTNVATATGTLPPEENLKETDEVDNHVLPDPSIEKTHSWEGMDTGVPLKKGGEFTYTITVKNAAGASSWEGVVLTDTLNELMSADPTNPVDYLVYVPNSTTLDGVPVADTSSWDSSKKQLQLNLGDFIGDANGTTKTVQFKVKLVQIPPKSPDGKIWIKNAATAVGTGTEADDTEKEMDVTDDDEFPLDNLLNKAKIHVRQVVLDANKKLVVPTLGYLTMTQSDATNQPLTGSTSGLNINSIDQNKWGNNTLKEVKDSFTTFSLALLPDQKVTQFDLTIPEYYEYLGDGFTKELTADNLTTHTTYPNDPNDPTVLRLALQDEGEYWITLFIKPTDEGKKPLPYSWDYKVNDFGKLKEPEFTVSAFPEDKIINSIPYWIYEVKNTGKDTIEDLVITGNLLTGPQGTTTYVPTNPSLISYDGGESIEELPGDINIDFNDKNTQAVITLPPTQTLEQNQTITIYLPFKAPGGGEFKSTATATGTRNGETIKATLVESPKRE